MLRPYNLRQSMGKNSHLLTIPHPRHLRLSHLLLQLKHPIQQGLRRWRTPRHIYVHRNNSIHASHHTITIMIIPASIRTATHTDNPAWLWHLVVTHAHRRRDLIGDGAGHDHDIGLSRGGAEDDAQAVLIVSWHGDVHHFDGAAGEAEAERPEGALAGPVDE